MIPFSFDFFNNIIIPSEKKYENVQSSPFVRAASKYKPYLLCILPGIFRRNDRPSQKFPQDPGHIFCGFCMLAPMPHQNGGENAVDAKYHDLRFWGMSCFFQIGCQKMCVFRAADDTPLKQQGFFFVFVRISRRDSWDFQ